MKIWKEILAPATYWTRSGPVTFTPADIRAFYRNGKEMLADQLSVPVPLEHQADAKPMRAADQLAMTVSRTAGTVSDWKIDGNNVLWAELDIGGIPLIQGEDVKFIRDEEDIAHFLKRNVKYVSPELCPSFKDGEGKVWRKVVSHVALTPIPVWHKQKPFGAEMAGGGALMSLRHPGVSTFDAVAAPLTLSQGELWHAPAELARVLKWEDADWPVSLASERAPRGGVTVGGVFYPGGRWIPAEALAAASPAEKAAAAGRRPGDVLPGGLADARTPAEFSADKLRAGAEVESEHTSDPKVAREIAMDHLTESPDYYEKLKAVEGVKPRSVVDEDDEAGVAMLHGDETKMQRINRLIDEQYAANLRAAGPARAVHLRSTEDRGGVTNIVVHPSAKHRGVWQLTWCDKDMVPFGDTTFASFEDAMASASGKSVDGVPPIGDRSYRVHDAAATQMSMGVEGRLRVAAKSLKGLSPGFGQVYWHPPSKTAWYVGFDGDEKDTFEKVEKALRVKGVKKVRYEAEASPKGDGWTKIWPRESAQMSLPVELSTLTPAQIKSLGARWQNGETIADLAKEAGLPSWQTLAGHFIAAGIKRGAPPKKGKGKPPPPPAKKGKGKKQPPPPPPKKKGKQPPPPPPPKKAKPWTEEQMAEKLAPHARTMTEDEAKAAGRTYAALLARNGDKAIERMGELMRGDLKAFPKATGEAKAKLSQRLAVYNHILGLAKVRREQEAIRAKEDEENARKKKEAHDRLYGGLNFGQPGSADDDGPLGPPPKNKPLLAKLITSRPDITQSGDPEKVPADLRKSLREHQVQAAALAIPAMEEQGGFVLADGTGAGKTRSQLAVAETFARQGKKVLIVTLKGVIKPNWNKREITGSFKDDSAAMGINAKLNDGTDPLKPGEVHLTSYERFKRMGGQVDKDTVLILDESHSLMNETSQRSVAAAEPLERAHSVMYCTATPGDKPKHLAYLHRSRIFGNRPRENTYLELGLKEVENRQTKEKEWQIDPRVGAVEVANRLNGLFDQMTKEGLMLKREIDMSGVQVNFKRYKTPPEAQVEMDKIAQEIANRGYKDPGVAKAMTNMAQRRHMEQYKVPMVHELVKQHLAAGRSVVVFADRVKESTMRQGRAEPAKFEPVKNEDGTPKIGPDGKPVMRKVKTEDKRKGVAVSDSTMKKLREMLEADGIKDIVELHGDSELDAGEAMDHFQKGRARVILTTVGSGGTGINLDDRRGDCPRAMVMLTPPLTAMSFMQAAGRVWRLQSKSYPIIDNVFTDSDVDMWNADLLAEKMSNLHAMVGGEVERMDVPDMGASDEDLMQQEIERQQGKHHKTYRDVPWPTLRKPKNSPAPSPTPEPAADHAALRQRYESPENMRGDMAFNDKHTGPRWTYALKNRPFLNGGAPRGFIIHSDRKHAKWPHGTIDYPFPLTQKEIEGYELEPQEGNPPTKMSRQKKFEKALLSSSVRGEMIRRKPAVSLSHGSRAMPDQEDDDLFTDDELGGDDEGDDTDDGDDSDDDEADDMDDGDDGDDDADDFGGDDEGDGDNDRAVIEEAAQDLAEHGLVVEPVDDPMEFIQHICTAAKTATANQGGDEDDDGGDLDDGAEAAGEAGGGGAAPEAPTPQYMAMSRKVEAMADRLSRVEAKDIISNVRLLQKADYLEAETANQYVMTLKAKRLSLVDGDDPEVERIKTEVAVLLKTAERKAKTDPILKRVVDMSRSGPAPVRRPEDQFGPDNEKKSGEVLDIMLEMNGLAKK